MSRLMSLGWLLLLVSAAEPTLVTVELAGEWPPGQTPTKVEVSLRPAGRDEAPAISTSIDTAIGTTSIRLPTPGSYLLSATGPGVWSPEIEVESGTKEQPVVIRLYPAGRLAGCLVPPPGVLPPDLVEVRVDRAPSAKQPEKLTTTMVQCPVRERRFICELPAGQLDLRLRLPGAAAQYLWGTAIVAAATKEAGDLPLRPGGSVSGWVETLDGHPVVGARAELQPAAPEDLLTKEDRTRTKRQALAAQTNERGFFQIPGVPRGHYSLRLSSEGLVAADIPTVEVREGLESHLREPVALDQPATLALSLVPATDPYGRLWRVRLVHADHRLKRSTGGQVTANGTFQASELAPGGYWLSVLDADGARWVEESLTIAPGANRHAAEVPLLEVRGSLSQGDDGLAATVLLSSAELRAAQIKLGSDVDGLFEGYLPGEGTWEVQVSLENGRTTVGLEPVTIRRRSGKGFAEINLRVPDTRVEGKVVREGGIPVAGADVRAGTIITGRGETLTTTDAKGSFLLQGLPEGAYVLFARTADEEESDGVPVSLDEDLDSPSVTLTLRSERELVGVVRSRQGAVPGATVIAIPEMAGLASASLHETYTGAGGVFRSKVPSTVSAATLVVAAPGFAIRIVRDALPAAGQPLIVEVDSGSGTISVPPEVLSPVPAGEQQSMPILFHDGAAVPLALILRLTATSRRIAGRAGALDLPNLESGSYMLCAGKDATRAWREGSAPPEESCRGGFLPPGGLLQL